MIGKAKEANWQKEHSDSLTMRLAELHLCISTTVTQAHLNYIDSNSSQKTRVMLPALQGWQEEEQKILKWMLDSPNLIQVD